VDRPRELGRTPVLPTPDLELAVGDGIVLAYARGMDDGAWLIDGRDPHAPRSVRRILVGDVVWAAALEGQQALLAVGNDVLASGELERFLEAHIDRGWALLLDEALVGVVMVEGPPSVS
jgi:hypothetical protein